jgi:hypothetical protein
MALFLIHKTFAGEPVGIHSDAEAPHYVPGFDAEERRGKQLVGARRSDFPWSKYVRQQVGQVSQQDWWAQEDSPLPMQQVLDEARAAYFDQKNDE